MARKNDSEPAPAEIASANPIPPPGVPADVQVKFRTGVNPQDYIGQREREPARNISDELNDLALDEDQELAPPSTFAQFCEAFSDYAGIALVNVVRLPDPADKRIPTSQFARVNFGEIEQLGSFTFDPPSLLASLQMLNGNSGGVFRLWLTDQSGALIPGARLDRLAVVDPLGARIPASQQPAPAPQPVRIEAPPPRELTDTEKQMQAIQKRIMDNALERLLNPPQPTAPQSPLNTLSPEDQLAVMLISKTDILGQAVEKITSLVKAGEAGSAPSTWQDKLTEVVTQNPHLIERVGGVVDKIVARIFGPDPRYDQAQYIPAPQPQPAQSHPYAAGPAPAQTTVNLPPDAPTDEDDEDMALLDELIAYLTSNDAIAKEHPIFRKLRTQYPVRFRFFVTQIAQAPSSDVVIEYLKTTGPLYKALLEGPLREHYSTRIEQLRQLCIAATQHAAKPTPTAPEQPPTPTE